MAAELTPEAKELSLVGKVEMRIALASSDKKLEDLLKTYLPPLLLKLGSESAAVRNKVRDLIMNTFCGPCFPWSPLIACFLGYFYLPTHQYAHQITVRISCSM
jgi:hypothetical protein